MFLLNVLFKIKYHIFTSDNKINLKKVFYIYKTDIFVFILFTRHLLEVHNREY